MNKEKTMKSYAKINLFLDILKKREDNYHEISTLFHTINLYDEITIQIKKIANFYGEDKFNYKINIECSNPEIPTDSSNLVYKAISLIIDNHYKDKNQNLIIDINIEKNIPAGGGLGGGSSNGATSLLITNELLNLNLSYNELHDIAIKVGADVPFFLTGGTAIGFGIGEKLTRVENFPKLNFILAFPDFFISTPWVYNNLKLKVLDHHENLEQLINSFMEKKIEIKDLLYNGLETVVIPRYNEIKKIKKIMLESGCSASLMSGSGSTVFGVFDHQISKTKLTSELEDINSKLIFTSSL